MSILEQGLKELGATEDDIKNMSNRPLWKGPEIDGITFSLLNRYLTDKERFRIYTYEGLAPKQAFSHILEFGNMWHICEETIAKKDGNGLWKESLKDYAVKLCKRFPYNVTDIDKWYNVCLALFPVYRKFRKEREKYNKRTSLLSEYPFHVRIHLPSGYNVLLRGKWDSVYILRKDGQLGIWLHENKTKGEIDEERIGKQLKYDLQTMLYLVALRQHCKGKFRYPVMGVVYNVVRRPLSGGKYTIRQHAPSKKNPNGESKQDFYKRLNQVFNEDPKHFFKRWVVKITDDDIDKFQQQTLIPLLTELCVWWSTIVECKGNPFGAIPGLHYRMPYGIYNPLSDNGHTEYDDYLDSGNTAGLEIKQTVFPELEC